MPEPTLLALRAPGTIAPAPDRGPEKARRLLERSASIQIDDETLKVETAGWFADPVAIPFGGTRTEEQALQPATGCRR